jgi:hypothetical protein
MAAECRSACAEQLFNRLHVRPVDAAGIAHCEGDRGSKNWPWTWGAAMGSARRLAELARKFGTEGFYATEFGSELYWPDVIAAQVEGLRQAAASGDSPTAELLAPILRATFAYLAVTAVPGPRVHTLLRMAGAEDSTTDGDARRYSGGVSVATPGHRFHPSVVGQGLLGPILAWALGYTAKLGLKITEDTGTNFWPLAALQLSLGAPYGAPRPAAAWGLEDEDRVQLRRLIEANDLDALTHAVGLLRGFPLVGELAIEVWGTAQGRTSRLDRAVSGLKPQIAAASIDRDGQYAAYVPAAWSRLQAPRAQSEDLGDRYRVFTPQASFEVLKVGGPALFRFRWDAAGGARWTAPDQVDDARPAPPLPTPPRPVPPSLAPQPQPPTQPADRAELNAIADDVAKLALARSQKALQQRIVSQLRAGPARPLAEIAEAVAGFAIGEGQAHAPLWRSIVERLLRLSA